MEANSAVSVAALQLGGFVFATAALFLAEILAPLRDSHLHRSV